MNGLAVGIPSGPELLIVLFVFVAIFGLGKWKNITKELPGAARLMGSGIRSFKKGLVEAPEEEDAPDASSPAAVAAPSAEAPASAVAAPSAEAPAPVETAPPPAQAAVAETEGS